jgi:RNA polymerase sigma-70 factor (ECF subfamily)
VDDATQEVFWVIARRLQDVRAGSEKSFLYGVALRIAADHHRRRLAVPDMAHPDEMLLVADPGPSPEESLAAHRARALLDVVLDQLPLRLRTVFVLAEIEGLEVRHIAELEGIPVGTAASRLRLAREEFRAASRRVRAAFLARKGSI